MEIEQKISHEFFSILVLQKSKTKDQIFMKLVYSEKYYSQIYFIDIKRKKN